MIIPVNGPKGPAAADKAKAKTRTGATGGPRFADFLDAASQADAAEVAAPAASTAVVGGFLPLEEDIPQDGRGQARELLKTLRSLAEDALSGSPTAAVTRLEQLAGSVDESSLNAAQKQVLDEVRTRAAVEVAKMRS